MSRHPRLEKQKTNRQTTKPPLFTSQFSPSSRPPYLFLGIYTAPCPGSSILQLGGPAALLYGHRPAPGCLSTAGERMSKQMRASLRFKASPSASHVHPNTAPEVSEGDDAAEPASSSSRRRSNCAPKSPQSLGQGKAEQQQPNAAGRLRPPVTIALHSVLGRKQTCSRTWDAIRAHAHPRQVGWAPKPALNTNAKVLH